MEAAKRGIRSNLAGPSKIVRGVVLGLEPSSLSGVLMGRYLFATVLGKEPSFRMFYPRIRGKLELDKLEGCILIYRIIQGIGFLLIVAFAFFTLISGIAVAIALSTATIILLSGSASGLAIISFWYLMIGKKLVREGEVTIRKWLDQVKATIETGDPPWAL